MNNTRHQDSLKKVIDIFEGEYSTPTKALVWAKTIKEWGGIVFGTVFLTVIILGLIGLFVTEVRKKTPGQTASVVYKSPIRSADPTNQDAQDHLSQQLVPHVKDLLLFTTVLTKSINTRQELLDELTTLLPSSDGQDQAALERKVTALGKISRQCVAEKGKFISEMAQAPNPFESEIYAAVKTFSGYPYRVFNELWEGPPLNPEHETLRWNQLCTLCQKELIRANELLLQKIGKAPSEPKD